MCAQDMIQINFKTVFKWPFKKNFINKVEVAVLKQISNSVFEIIL